MTLCPLLQREISAYPAGEAVAASGAIRAGEGHSHTDQEEEYLRKTLVSIPGPRITERGIKALA